MMNISTSRIEALSDGVIAIIMTVMVFDLKAGPDWAEEKIGNILYDFLPKLSSYVVSFLMLAIMWVNHHQLFQQIKYVGIKFLWLNMHLLFWMTLIPFSTHFIGSHPFAKSATFFYGIIFFMCAFSFSSIRRYAYKHELFIIKLPPERQQKILNKNKLAMLIYAAAAGLGFVSVYISILFFLIVPVFYMVPEFVDRSTKS